MECFLKIEIGENDSIIEIAYLIDGDEKHLIVAKGDIFSEFAGIGIVDVLTIFADDVAECSTIVSYKTDEVMARIKDEFYKHGLIPDFPQEFQDIRYLDKVTDFDMTISEIYYDIFGICSRLSEIKQMKKIFNS